MTQDRAKSAMTPPPTGSDLTARLRAGADAIKAWREDDRRGGACIEEACEAEDLLREAAAALQGPETVPPFDRALKLAMQATNGWACYAKRKIEHDEIARLHRDIAALDPARFVAADASSPAPHGSFGYCAGCYHPLDRCSHCDIPPPAPDRPEER